MTIDLSYLEKMAGGDVSTKKMMLKVLRDELSKDVPRVKGLYQGQDWEELSRFCHHFKSTIVFSGNQRLIQANEKLWDIAKRKGQNANQGEQLISTIESQGRRVQQEVQQVLRQLQ